MNWLQNLFVKSGVIESINLTYGGAGNQIMRINGVNYATWIDVRKWPKIGERVRHKPYKTRDGRGGDLLATEILYDVTKKNLGL